MKRVRRALISVYEKEGIVAFAQTLAALNIEILSTGGTAATLRENKVPVKDISAVTGFPEILGGRVKSLHPLIHGGVLAERSNPEHLETMKRLNIPAIDMVVINLYPFTDVISRPETTLEEALHNIDIGGPALLRAAAKNFTDVVVVIDPADYERVARMLKEHDGVVDAPSRRELAVKAFRRTSAYDEAIFQYLVEKDIETGRIDKAFALGEFPLHFSLAGTRKGELRYGENPHQRAVLYTDRKGGGIANAKQLHGKQLSYNNLLDLDAAYMLAFEFEEPAAVIVKHNNPCGAATGADLRESFVLARTTDPQSAYGGVLALNRKVDAATASEISEGFVEAIAAPGYEPAALELLTRKKLLRLIETPFDQASHFGRLMFRQVTGGFLVQELDMAAPDARKATVVTRRAPTEEEWNSMAFGWKIVKHVRSNAIVLARSNRTLGIGAGQMSRVDSARIAVMKACEPPKGACCASDAFFPFRDGLDTVAQAGVTAVIQPGGSKRDSEVIEAADEQGIAMVFTGIRHFRH